MQSDSVKFLSLEEVLAIHEKLIDRFGGATGIRDQGLLESALFRPQTGYYDDLSSMGAAMFESLLLNHAFVDGNKRVAFFATDVFLRLNGWKIQADNIEAHKFLIANLEAGTCDYEALRAWIRDHLTDH
ncbi:MAG: type II toxin-antitoxin system death-on-curing family toxin [Proteobacteria bacterium]|nr:type II toxin-antitoxin system death-on-curing family toxin [Pseudomonadota bacterium]